LKNVELNSHIHESINFFECNTIWSEKNRDEALETKAFAGIFAAVQAMSFYDYKAMLQSMFATLHMSVVWEKSHQEIEPWFERTQVADLFVDGVKIGRAGMLSQAFTRTLFKHQGFSFELYADKIIQYKPTVKQFKPWSKYQAVSVDISMLVDATMTAQTIGNLIYTVDHKIDNVMLVDFFEKDEWKNKRSLTFRYRICDFEHNVTKDVIDAITHRVITTMQNIGAVIR
jgi:phenylalanyl-tRNA synthetase beta subunit